MLTSAKSTTRDSSLSAARHVAILMCTKNGAPFLADQLKSIAQQTHADWALFASDDGSDDETREILERFASNQRQNTVVRGGPGKGTCANFLSLAADPTIDADYFAFSDQDDIWHPEKLERALNWLATVRDDIPAFYCGRTELMTADGRVYGLSPLFKRAPAFENALVQSLAGGNTIVFNRATKKLIEQMGTIDVVLHDWWTYQLVSAAGGAIRYDPTPLVKYRQHSQSQIGSNLGWRARSIRIGMMLYGRFREWNETNITALKKMPEQVMQPAARIALENFMKARVAPSLPARLRYLYRSGVYRQTWLSSIGLLFATIIKKI